MSTLGQDIGTVAILALCALTILIRARYFCRYGKEAMLVVLLYILTTVPLRITTVHGGLEPEYARVIAGYFAIVCVCVQFSVMVLGEGMLREEREHYTVNGK